MQFQLAQRHKTEPISLSKVIYKFMHRVSQVVLVLSVFSVTVYSQSIARVTLPIDHPEMKSNNLVLATRAIAALKRLQD